MVPALCTVIAKNHLPRARVLYKSFIRLHPEGQCYVLIVDGNPEFKERSAEAFKMIVPEELKVAKFDELAFKYSAYELCNAIKPFFFRFLFLEKALERILFLDSDIMVLNPLNDLFALMKAHDILVTPHLDEDFPEDGKVPSDRQLLQAGIYNLGFIGMKNTGNTLRFLTWWMGKLENKCLSDVTTGYFVDQKFIDFASCFFEKIHTVRDQGYNVAYWNLHSRHVRFHQGRWQCNAQPLYFFHFSGYSPDVPSTLSKYQNRFDLSSLPELGSLFAEYRKVLAENDYDEASKLSYTFDFFSNGEKIDADTRRYYQKLIAKSKMPEGSPFDLPGLKKQAQRDLFFQYQKRAFNFLRRLFSKRLHFRIGPRSKKCAPSFSSLHQSSGFTEAG